MCLDNYVAIMSPGVRMVVLREKNGWDEASSHKGVLAGSSRLASGDTHIHNGDKCVCCPRTA